MDEKRRGTSNRRSGNFWQIILIVLGSLLVALVIFPPLFAAEAASEKSLSSNDRYTGSENVSLDTNAAEPSAFFQQQPVQTDTPTATETPTETATAPNTETATATETSTSTITATITVSPTATETLTQTTTGTVTRTPTITTTPTLTNTPTATGTITPIPTLKVVVTPSQATVGQRFTFTISVGNGGTAPYQDAILISQSLPTTVNLETVTVDPSDHGIVTKLTRSFTVALDDVYPGEDISITAVVLVNSSLTATQSIPFTVTMTYDTSRSITARVYYKLVASTLPGTGDLPLDWRQRAARDNLAGGWLLGGFGIGTVISGVWIRKRRHLAVWIGLIGMILLLGGIFAGCSSVSDNSTVPMTEPSYISPSTPEQPEVPYQPASAFSTPEEMPIITLPDFPIPTPVLSATQSAGEDLPDTSPVVRIVIPSLILDTVVKYVPYDGFSWLIAGLRDEVAWMGNTSWPGLGSNTALAGHVTVSGWGDGPFRFLDELPIGEVVILYTENNIYTYQVRESHITDPEDLSVTYPTENPQVTLITCVDWDEDSTSYLKRLIVYGDLVRVEPVVRGSLP